ncbi:hypothetical protein LY78DRAFT_198982 [Colletotrichum sublineola]|nr:hypothetical protein LY78DRAFT_198982 [Colletotrichum sublineola]
MMELKNVPQLLVINPQIPVRKGPKKKKKKKKKGGKKPPPGQLFMVEQTDDPQISCPVRYNLCRHISNHFSHISRSFCHSLPFSREAWRSSETSATPPHMSSVVLPDADRRSSRPFGLTNLEVISVSPPPPGRHLKLSTGEGARRNRAPKFPPKGERGMPSLRLPGVRKKTMGSFFFFSSLSCRSHPPPVLLSPPYHRRNPGESARRSERHLPSHTPSEASGSQSPVDGRPAAKITRHCVCRSYSIELLLPWRRLLPVCPLAPSALASQNTCFSCLLLSSNGSLHRLHPFL